MTVIHPIGRTLEDAVLFHNFVLERWSHGTFPATLRNRIFVALCDLVLEHHGAIVSLVRSGQHYGSALALLRPLAETCHRAFWVLNCVDDEQLGLIIRGKKQFPRFDVCRREVEEYYSLHTFKGVFAMSAVYTAQLHGLTHTGIEQLQFRFDGEGNLGPTYPNKPISLLLSQASMWLTMSAIAYIQLVEGSENSLAPKTGEITNKFLQLFRPNGA